MSVTISPVGILLAAGQSRRFGSQKLLHPLYKNTSILQASLHNLTSVIKQVVVVISPQLEHYREQIEQPGVSVVLNKQAELGMATSLACGIRASEEAGKIPNGWIVAPGDMPYIKPETIHALLARYRSNQHVVAPYYQSRRGHPVIFPASFKDRLLAIQGDQGARQLIEQSLPNVELIKVDDSGVLFDIDYIEDIDK